MKTYKQFNQDINENIVGLARNQLGRAWKFTRPLKTIDRYDNAKVITNKGSNVLDKASSAYGIVKPFSFPSYMYDIFKLGNNKYLTKGMNKIDQVTKNVTKGRIRSDVNPKTDIGARLSKKIFSPLKTVFQKRNTNAGANDLIRQNNMG